MENINKKIIIEEDGMQKSTPNKENSWIRELEWSEIPEYTNNNDWENDENEP